MWELESVSTLGMRVSIEDVLESHIVKVSGQLDWMYIRGCTLS